jgi:putative ABC transport system permease protein
MLEIEGIPGGPDWKRYVRDQLPHLAIDTEREMEIVEELAEHLDAVYQDALAKGASEEEAHKRAALLFADWRLLECELAVAERGGAGARLDRAISEREQKSQGGRLIMESLLQDLRYGIRMLLKNPGFAAVAIITLALGIGANTAIFTVINAVLLRPLPLPESERLMKIGRNTPKVKLGDVDDPRFLFWREQSRSFEAMGAHISWGAALTGGGEPEIVSGRKISQDFFRALGVAPAIGRGFTKEEDSAGGERVAILSDGLWRRRFEADPGLIGKTITLNGEGHAVVGIMPSDFRFTSPFDVFVPLRPGPTSGNTGFNLEVLARLNPGVTRDQALAEMKLVAERLRAKEPKMVGEGETVNVVPYLNVLTAYSRQLLWLLFGAVSFVLLIACANVANLLLTRAAAREREIAVRLAVGAGWRRVARQLLVEGLVLALAGGAAGLLLAVWGTRLLTAMMPGNLIPRVDEIGIDWRVMVFTLAAAVITGLLFSLAPSIQAGRVDLNAALKEGGNKGAAGMGRGKLRSLLVVIEVALALVLLIGSTLLIRTFAKLNGVDPGFDPQNVLTFRVTARGARYATPAQSAEFYRQTEERIKILAGVESVAATNLLPLEGQYNLPVEIEGKLGQFEHLQFRLITQDYFRVMRIGLKLGRELTAGDTQGAENVAIVNEAFVRRYLANRDPIGQQIYVGRTLGAPAPLHIVGVVGDTKGESLALPAPPTVFFPVSQMQEGVGKLLKPTMRFVVRTTNESYDLGAAIKRELYKIDPSLPVTNIRSMSEIASISTSHLRFNMLLLGIFAGIGLALAAIGIYGVMSYVVEQGTHEIGVRMALGAQTRDVMRLVIKQGMVLALAGVTIGLAASLALTRLLKSMLFGVSANDPATFALVAVMLAGVAMVACFIPARRATKVDPIIALRQE